jgi:hypothetical protein
VPTPFESPLYVVNTYLSCSLFHKKVEIGSKKWKNLQSGLNLLSELHNLSSSLFCPRRKHSYIAVIVIDNANIRVS